MTQVTIRYNAEPHHVFKCGDIEIHGGQTAKVPVEEGELLAERNPGEIELIGHRARGRAADSEPASEAADKKEGS